MASLDTLLKKVRELNGSKNHEQVITLLPDNILEKHKSADLYAEKADAYYREKNYQESEKLVDISLRIDPNQAKANYFRGAILASSKNYPEAIQCFNKAIETDPNLPHPYNGLGNVYSEQKNYLQAVHFYKKGIETDPKFEYSYLGLGEIYLELKNYHEAINYFKKSIKINRKSIYSLDGLGSAFSNLGEYNKAILYFNRAIKIDPKFKQSFNGMGNTYLAQKSYSQAISCYDKAIEIDIDYPEPYFNRATTNFIQRKNYQLALADYQKYIVLTEDSPDYFTSLAKERVEEIKKLLGNEDYEEINSLVAEIKGILLFEDEPVTHYTGLTVAKELILKDSKFRLSEGAFLNDTSEGRELYKFLPQPLLTSIPNIDTRAEPFTQKPFIGSFVAEIKHDDLTLWRMYGKENKEEANGCAITIDQKKFIDGILDSLRDEGYTNISDKIGEEFRFYRVAYISKKDPKTFLVPGAKPKEELLNKSMRKLHLKIGEFIKKKGKRIREVQSLIELLNEIAYLFKSADYQYEHELRLVVKGTGFKKEIEAAGIPPKVFIELVSIIPMIKKITLGPKVQRAEEWAAAFYYELDSQVYYPEILISHLPFK